MFNNLSDILKAKFGRKDDLSKQLQIVKVFDLYRAELKKIFPEENDIRLISLRNKTLTLGIASSVLANELRMRETEIVEVINQKLGKETISRVIYRF